MIARLTGRLLVKEPSRLILDVAGVGYEVHIPVSTFYALPEVTGEVTLEIHTHMRDDAITLYGFTSRGEKRLFERLIGVSGVGPKLACTLLSGLQPDEVVAAVRAGEPAPLLAVPGIGRRTAERIVVELRDRLGPPGETEEAAEAPPTASAGRAAEDAVSALRNLGYRETAARRAVRRAGTGGGAENLEGLLRESLRLLSGGGADA